MKKIHVLTVTLLAFALVNCSSTPDKAEEESINTPAAAVEEDLSGIESYEEGSLEGEGSEEDEIALLGEAILEEPAPADEAAIEAELDAQPVEVIMDSDLGETELADVPYDGDSLHGIDDGLEYETPAVQKPVVLTSAVPIERPVTRRVIVQQARQVERLEYTPQKTIRDYEVVQLNLDRPKLESQGFRNGMKVFKKDCNMRAAATRSARILGQVDAGKRLWVDHFSAKWAKVYRKKGPAYVYKGCL